MEREILLNQVAIMEALAAVIDGLYRGLKPLAPVGETHDFLRDRLVRSRKLLKEANATTTNTAGVLTGFRPKG